MGVILLWCSLPDLAMDSEVQLSPSLGMELFDRARNESTQISNWVWNCIFYEVS